MTCCNCKYNKLNKCDNVNSVRYGKDIFINGLCSEYEFYVN